MGLETFGFIDSLNSSNPVGASDPKSQGDDHLRGIKSTLLASFPGISGAVTATHTELNLLDGVTLSTAQINDAARQGFANTFTEPNTFSHAWTIGEGYALQIASADPGIEFTETDAATDTKTTVLSMDSGGNFVGYLASDDRATYTEWLRVERTTTTVDRILLSATEVELSVTTLDVNGAADISSNLTVGGTVVVTGTTTLNSNVSVNAQVLQVNHGTPIFRLNENDQATDEGNWDLRVSSASFRARTLTDAFGAGTEWLVVSRGTGTDIASTTLAGDKVVLNGQTSSLYVDNTAGAIEFLNTTTVRVRDGSALRFYDSTDSDNVDMYHDGTDMRIAGGSGTTDLRLTGFNHVNFGTVRIESDNNAADEPGYKGVPQDTDDDNYTFVLTDAGRSRRYNGTGGHSYTVPPNSSVAFPSGTVLTVVNISSTQSLTLAQGSGVTLVWDGVGSTGNRTLAPRSIATLYKYTTDAWIVSGGGVS